MPTPICPDCDVAMEFVHHSSSGSTGDTVRIDDPRKPSTLGFGGKTYLDAYLCRECDLVRWYAPE